MNEKPGKERVILVIDGRNDLTFMRYGWFFGNVCDVWNGVKYYHYLDFVESVKMDWKSYACYNEYYIGGEWHRRTASCGEVRE